MASPMLENGVEGASGVLLSLAGSSTMTLHEVNQAATAVAEHCTPDANVIFGATVDDNLGDVMRVTVIAAGFGKTPAAVGGERPRFRAPSVEIPTGARATTRSERAPVRAEAEVDALDDLEIPDFLRG
jgi:cell division protein FtsZ